MKRYFKIAFLILLGVFIVMQFINRPTKNISDGVQVNSITQLLPINDTINKIFKNACYDCHSNNTVYPWYANIMPVGWILNNHIVDGKKHFNFDVFKTYKAKKALHKLEEVAEEVEKGAMPMDSYTTIHKDAKLTATEKQQIISWAKNSREALKVIYKDSIIQ